MNHEDIIKMAQEAGIIQPQMVINTLEDFAKLVAQHEREGCAQLCEASPEPDGLDLADRIRARR